MATANMGADIEKCQHIVNYLAEHPGMSNREAARQLGIQESYIRRAKVKTQTTAEVQVMLSESESRELGECEAVIARGFQTFIEVGNALFKIRDGRLYRASHGTFETYCRERWGMSKTHVNRLVDAAGVAENLTPIGVNPTAESQVRPLSQLEPEQQREAWSKAVSTAPDGQPTARQVQAAVDEVIASNPAIASDPQLSQRELEDRQAEEALDGYPDLLQEVISGTCTLEDALQRKREPGCDDDRDEPETVHVQGDPEPDAETQFLESLPLREKLNERCRAIFDEDALAYRQVHEHLIAIKRTGITAKRVGKIQGEFQYRIGLAVHLPPPNAWLKCGAENCVDGLKGDGQACDRCFGRGYRLS